MNTVFRGILYTSTVGLFRPLFDDKPAEFYEGLRRVDQERLDRQYLEDLPALKTQWEYDNFSYTQHRGKRLYKKQFEKWFKALKFKRLVNNGVVSEDDWETYIDEYLKSRVIEIKR